MVKNLPAVNQEVLGQQWAVRIRDCRNSNLTVRTWCQRNNIAVSTYYKWQKKLFDAAVELKEKSTVRFAEITAPQNYSATPGKIIATLEVNGITVKLYPEADARTIAEICKGLKLC